MIKVFIDGREGTTGLRIDERLKLRDDVEVLRLPEDFRKDVSARCDAINSSDVTFLCLPDDAAREAVSLVKNRNTVVIDASTAHRTREDWAYGFAELSPEHREKIASGKRIANPGCYASGFVALVYPLVKAGIVPADYPFVCHAVSGYSGGGKKAIARGCAARSRARLSQNVRALSFAQTSARNEKGVCSYRNAHIQSVYL